MLWLEALCGMAAAGTRGRTHVELWGLDTGKNVTLPKYMPNLVNQHSTATMDFSGANSSHFHDRSPSNGQCGVAGTWRR